MVFKTILEIIEGYKNQDFSIIEVVTQYLDNIEQLEPKINALITLRNKEEILKEAKEKQKILEEAIKTNGQDALFKEKPLFGIPVVVKDMFLTKGLRTTAASKVLDNFIPQYDGTVISKLKQAGVIILAKANQDAWAHGSSGENSDYGPTHNPWHYDYVPGGSSSGSAASLMAGYAPFTTGTDTGGSIRQPASLTGVVGLKPTYGRVSRFGVIAMASSLDSIGHFTLDVKDSAYILSITAGHDSLDATTYEDPVPDYLTELEKMSSLDRAEWLKGKKIGILKQGFEKGVEDVVSNTVLNVAKKLEEFGATVIDVSLPEIEYGLPLYYIIQTAEVSSNLARYDGVRYGNPRTYFGAEAKRRIMLGNYILSDVVEGKQEATTYFKAAEGKALLTQKMLELFNKVDAFILPVSPTLPFKIGEKTSDPLQMYMSDLLTVSTSIVGVPGISINAGFAEKQDAVLPIGMQIVSNFLDELTLFEIGLAVESITPNIIEEFKKSGLRGYKH